ncbi:MAG: 6-carboxytetrahydropterin synthase [Planctomycetota bacterium]
MKTYEATVTHAFRASHAVPLETGGVEDPHEHDWRVSATFRSARLAEPMGVVIDFTKVQTALAAVASELENADLNAHAAFAGKSSAAERLAEYIAGRLAELLEVGKDSAELYRVAVTEAPGCEAAFYPRGS